MIRLDHLGPPSGVQSFTLRQPRRQTRMAKCDDKPEEASLRASRCVSLGKAEPGSRKKRILRSCTNGLYLRNVELLERGDPTPAKTAPPAFTRREGLFCWNSSFSKGDATAVKAAPTCDIASLVFTRDKRSQPPSECLIEEGPAPRREVLFPLCKAL